RKSEPLVLVVAGASPDPVFVVGHCCNLPKVLETISCFPVKYIGFQRELLPHTQVEAVARRIQPVVEIGELELIEAFGIEGIRFENLGQCETEPKSLESIDNAEVAIHIGTVSGGIDNGGVTGVQLFRSKIELVHPVTPR